jgi:hypothetical protein
MDPGIAGSVGAALWCLCRFNLLERSRVGSRRGRAARLRATAMSWSAVAVVLSGAGACLLAGCAFAAAARPNPTAAVLYTAICTGVLGLVLAVEALILAHRAQATKEAAKRERKGSLRTLMRAAPHSQARF